MWNANNTDKCVGVVFGPGGYGPAGLAGGSLCYFKWLIAEDFVEYSSSSDGAILDASSNTSTYTTSATTLSSGTTTMTSSSIEPSSNLSTSTVPTFSPSATSGLTRDAIGGIVGGIVGGFAVVLIILWMLTYARKRRAGLGANIPQGLSNNPLSTNGSPEMPSGQLSKTNNPSNVSGRLSSKAKY